VPEEHSHGTSNGRYQFAMPFHRRMLLELATYVRESKHNRSPRHGEWRGLFIQYKERAAYFHQGAAENNGSQSHLLCSSVPKIVQESKQKPHR